MTERTYTLVGTRRGRSIALLAAAALAGACAGADATADTDDAPRRAPTTTTALVAPPATSTTLDERPQRTPPREVGSVEELVAVPDPLPDTPHGTLLKYLEVDAVHEGATAYRIMYLSESVSGAPIVVTGLASVPDGPAPAGGRVTLALAHGTTGVADGCEPSGVAAFSTLRRLAPLIAEDGWLAVESDYEGLGTPGRHPYLVGVSEGRGVVDSARAAAALPGAGASGRVAIAGYSQGGHGALWAAEVAGTWAPELEVVGTFAGAPATEIDLILTAGRSLPVGGFVLSIIAGYEAAYPEADPALLLTPAGLEVLTTVDEGCIGELIATTGRHAPGELMRPVTAETTVWDRLVAENNPGRVATEAPVLIVHSDGDRTVPAGLSARLFERMCGVGQVAERRVLVDGGDHGPAAPVAFAQGFDWLRRRLAGAATTGGCKG